MIILFVKSSFFTLNNTSVLLTCLTFKWLPFSSPLRTSWTKRLLCNEENLRRRLKQDRWLFQRPAWQVCALCVRQDHRAQDHQRQVGAERKDKGKGERREREEMSLWIHHHHYHLSPPPFTGKSLPRSCCSSWRYTPRCSRPANPPFLRPWPCSRPPQVLLLLSCYPIVSLLCSWW